MCKRILCEYMLSFGENGYLDYLKHFARLRNGPPKTSMSCDSVTLYGKMCFADGIKLRILRWGDQPDCLSGSHIITSIFIRGRK